MHLIFFVPHPTLTMTRNTKGVIEKLTGSSSQSVDTEPEELEHEITSEDDDRSDTSSGNFLCGTDASSIIELLRLWTWKGPLLGQKSDRKPFEGSSDDEISENEITIVFEGSALDTHEGNMSDNLSTQTQSVQSLPEQQAQQIADVAVGSTKNRSFASAISVPVLIEEDVKSFVEPMPFPETDSPGPTLPAESRDDEIFSMRTIPTCTSSSRSPPTRGKVLLRTTSKLPTLASRFVKKKWGSFKEKTRKSRSAGEQQSFDESVIITEPLIEAVSEMWYVDDLGTMDSAEEGSKRNQDVRGMRRKYWNLANELHALRYLLQNQDQTRDKQIEAMNSRLGEAEGLYTVVDSQSNDVEGLRMKYSLLLFLEESLKILEWTIQDHSQAIDKLQGNFLVLAKLEGPIEEITLVPSLEDQETEEMRMKYLALSEEVRALEAMLQRHNQAHNKAMDELKMKFSETEKPKSNDTAQNEVIKTVDSNRSQRSNQMAQMAFKYLTLSEKMRKLESIIDNQKQARQKELEVMEQIKVKYLLVMSEEVERLTSSIGDKKLKQKEFKVVKHIFSSFKNLKSVY